MASSPSTRTKVFISYSHKDQEWLERLKRHLKPLVREGSLDYWDDTHIRPGDDWQQEIRTALDRAQVAVLLISADFFASDFINENELPPLLDAAQAKGVRVLPVILSASRFARDPSLTRFQSVNSPGRPLNKVPEGEQEEVLECLAEAIESALTPKSPLAPPIPSDKHKPNLAFLGSPSPDLTTYRDAIFAAINNLDVWRASYSPDWGSTDEQRLELARSEIEACDIFIALVGHAYGRLATYRGRKASLSEHEYDLALSFSKKKRVLVAPDNFKSDYDYDDSDTLKQKTFRSKIQGSDIFDIRGDPIDVAADVAQDVATVEELPSTTPTQARIGKPTRHFTGRTSNVTDVVTHLLDKSCVRTDRHILLHGMSGIGKTELAKAVAYDQAIRRYFDDRIYFVDLLARNIPVTPQDAMRDIVCQIAPNVSPSSTNDWRYVLERNIKRLQNSLIILDDAANVGQIEHIVDCLPLSCRAIITSREKFFPRNVDPEEVRLLLVDDAVKLLRLKLHKRRESDETLARVARLCDCLPLALVAVGRDLEKNPEIDIDDYSIEPRDLRRIRAQTGIDVPEALQSMVKRLSQDDSDLVNFWTLLSVFPSDFDAKAAATVGAILPIKVKAFLRDLRDYNLLFYDAISHRYRLHALFRSIFETSDFAINVEEMENARMRLSGYFCEYLRDKTASFREESSGSQVPEALLAFDLEWSNIETGQRWAVENVYTSRREMARKFCIEYCSDNFELLNLRLTPKQRIPWIDQALAAVRQEGGVGNESKFLDELGVAYREKGMARSACDLHRQALGIAEKLQNLSLETSARGNLGRGYWELGEPDNAKKEYEKALAIAERIGDEKQQEGVLDCLGIMYRESGDPQSAKELHIRAEKIANENRDRRGEARAVDNQGLDCLRLSRYEEALGLFDRAYEISQTVSDIALSASILDHRGEAYRERGELKQAMECCETALKTAEPFGDLRVIGRIKGNIGLLFLRERQIQKALECFEEQRVIAEKSEDCAGQCASLYHIGLASIEAGEFDFALASSQKSLALANRLKIPDMQKRALLSIEMLLLWEKDCAQADCVRNKRLEVAENLKSSILYLSVHKCGDLTDFNWDMVNSDTPNVREFPYGFVALPRTDCDGHAVVVVKQPGAAGRQDVLIVEKSCEMSVDGSPLERCRDPRPGHEDEERLRVVMEQSADDAGGQPASVARLRIETDLGPKRWLDRETRGWLRAIRYSIRAGDVAGWFEHGDDAFPDPAFRHGHPDIATRDQGDVGIRGPSRPAMGLQAPIEPALFIPHRPRSLHPGERIIYELHVGTFTPEGTFSTAADRLGHVKDMGFTTIQVMPVDLSSGMPGWSYDQTRTGAVESAVYGGTEGLVRFVERAHCLGLEVIADKQYNHEGPEQDSRGRRIIPGMFGRQTKWGAGLSGRENPHYGQVIKLIGEEMAYWVSHFGIDGFRFDATNRLPAEIHQCLADFGRAIEASVQKPIYLLSEYAECQEPAAQRVPTGHQYADQTGRLLMKLLDLSQATHVTELPNDGGSTLKAMLKAARRGWWYPGVPAPQGGLSGVERSTTLLWNHDWIGNRFGGERISQLVSFALYKTIAVWQALGQWTPFIFMGTETYSTNPWYFFTGHRDDSTKNNTSAYYQEEDGRPVLKGGRFFEFRAEAEEIGLREALAFSTDGTVAGIDWQAFRGQRDKFGNPYMDHARKEVFEASKMNWVDDNDQQRCVRSLFTFILEARADERIKEPDPTLTQYKGWEQSERVFLFRRRDREGHEFVALFNLGRNAVVFRISADGVEAQGIGREYIVAINEGTNEAEWNGNGRFSLWLDTDALHYGGRGALQDHEFDITDASAREVRVAAESVIVFAKDPL